MQRSTPFISQNHSSRYNEYPMNPPINLPLISHYYITTINSHLKPHSPLHISLRSRQVHFLEASRSASCRSLFKRTWFFSILRLSLLASFGSVLQGGAHYSWFPRELASAQDFPANHIWLQKDKYKYIYIYIYTYFSKKYIDNDIGINVLL